MAPNVHCIYRMPTQEARRAPTALEASFCVSLKHVTGQAWKMRKSNTETRVSSLCFGATRCKVVSIKVDFIQVLGIGQIWISKDGKKMC